MVMWIAKRGNTQCAGLSTTKYPVGTFPQRFVLARPRSKLDPKRVLQLSFSRLDVRPPLTQR